MGFCFTVCANLMVQAGQAGRLVTEHVEYSLFMHPVLHPMSSIMHSWIMHSWNKCQIVNSRTSRTISYD